MTSPPRVAAHLPPHSPTPTLTGRPSGPPRSTGLAQHERAPVCTVNPAAGGRRPPGRLQGTKCEPPPPRSRPSRGVCLVCASLPHDPLEQLQRSSHDMGRLRVVTANCGGLGSEPRKVPRLIAYLACAGRDIAHLQEAGTEFAATWLAGLPYRVCVGPLFPGGGLVTLVHARLLNGTQVREHAQEHSLSVRVELTRGAVLATVNLHLPPAEARRRTVISDTSALLHTAGASVKIVAGDLNKAQGPRGRGWLSTP